jgi:hypothetical protein
LATLKLVTHEHIRPDRLAHIVDYIRRHRIMHLPSRMGIEQGFKPIQVEVLELAMDGGLKRIEMLNRGGALCFLKNPVDIRRFHRFIHELEESLPASLRPLL